MKIAFSLPLLIREEKNYVNGDIKLLNNFLETLQGCEDAILIIYNGGCLTDGVLNSIMKNYDINYEIIGSRTNVGLPTVKQRNFEYIWRNYKEVPYIASLHLDMVFYKEWYKSLINYLEEHPEEPMVSPGVINSTGNYSMDLDKVIKPPKDLNELVNLIQSIKVNKVIEGFANPAIHRASLLKEIGGIQTSFFRDDQGDEDYSILMGYYNYMGAKLDWKPKMCGTSTVYHGMMSQRSTVEDFKEHMILNYRGLYELYGAYGFKIVSEMLGYKEDNISKEY